MRQILLFCSLFMLAAVAGESTVSMEFEVEKAQVRLAVLQEEAKLLQGAVEGAKFRLSLVGDSKLRIMDKLMAAEKAFEELSDTRVEDPKVEVELQTKVAALKKEIEDRKRETQWHETQKELYEYSRGVLANHLKDLKGRLLLAEVGMNAANFRLSRAKQDPPRTWPLWDGKESMQDYGKRVGLFTEKRIRIRNETLVLKLVPAGKFMMGSPASEKPNNDEALHEVTISEPFYMSQHEITQAQYKDVIGVVPQMYDDAVGPQYPVRLVSWLDAIEFTRACRNGVKLPTEAQWEFACRAGTTTAFFSGSSATDLEKHATFKVGNKETKLQPVGQKLPNTFGLFDMHGSVEEWCEDGFEEVLRGPVTDPFMAFGSDRVSRGGSFSENDRVCRSGRRVRQWPRSMDSDLGIRIVTPYDAPDEPPHPLPPAPKEDPDAVAKAEAKKDGKPPAEKRYTEKQILELSEQANLRVPDVLARPWVEFYPAWQRKDGAAFMTCFYTTRKSDQELLEHFCAGLEAQKGIREAAVKKFGEKETTAFFRFKHVGYALSLGDELPLCGIERGAARHELNGESATLTIPVQPLDEGEDEDENPLFVLRKFPLRLMDGQWRLDFGVFTNRIAGNSAAMREYKVSWMQKTAERLKKLRVEMESGTIQSLNDIPKRATEIAK